MMTCMEGACGRGRHSGIIQPAHIHKNLKTNLVHSIMIIEHIFYSAALAILAGMVFYNYTGRDPSWIIIPCSLAPDLDYITLHHGAFHTIGFMVIFGIVAAFLLRRPGIKFIDALFFSVTGFGAHLFEDALVYDPGYMFLWPFSSKILGFGILPGVINEEYYARDFFYLANTEVLIIGVLFLLVAILIRIWYERSSSWIRWYMPDTIYEKFFRKMNPVS